MWQALYDELEDRDFTVIAVAMDDPEAARPWIEQAAPAYPALVDREHRLADLYGMVNVPQAVWIDEAGRIVRPTETAGVYESFRSRNLETGVVPDGELAKSKRSRAVYLDAIRDWVATGADSVHALDPATARARLPATDADTALAHAAFRLGRYLVAEGKGGEGEALIAQAVERHPDSWTMWRQAAAKLDNGLAAGPAFWARVRALGDKRYYPPAKMAGMPE